jgi:hypothetical protein
VDAPQPGLGGVNGHHNPAEIDRFDEGQPGRQQHLRAAPGHPHPPCQRTEQEKGKGTGDDSLPGEVPDPAIGQGLADGLPGVAVVRRGQQRPELLVQGDAAQREPRADWAKEREGGGHPLPE